jgi:hypothetical protein
VAAHRSTYAWLVRFRRHPEVLGEPRRRGGTAVCVVALAGIAAACVLLAATSATNP